MRILGIVALGAALGGGAFQRAEVAQQAQARRDKECQKSRCSAVGPPKDCAAITSLREET
jgi:hypothetical protein